MLFNQHNLNKTGNRKLFFKNNSLQLLEKITFRYFFKIDNYQSQRTSA